MNGDSPKGTILVAPVDYVSQAQVFRAVHDAHAASAELRDDTGVPDRGADHGRQSYSVRGSRVRVLLDGPTHPNRT